MANRRFGGYPIEHFVTNEGERALTSRKWRLGVYQRVFSLRNALDAPDEEELLHGVFEHFLNEAKALGSARKFSCIIRSELITSALQIPYRRFQQNDVEVLVNAFQKFQRSNDDVELLGAPLSIEIVTGPIDDDDKTEGSGPTRPKRIRHNIDRRSLIEVT
jgi:hypothetical protein